MLSLALIIGIGALVTGVVGYRSHYRLKEQIGQLRDDIKTERQEILDEDRQNDTELIIAVATAETPIADQLRQYMERRADMAPRNDLDDPCVWADSDLDDVLQSKLREAAAACKRKALYRAFLQVATILTITAVLAGWQYGRVSSATYGNAASAPSSFMNP